ncbi:MAG: SRPBCC family protein [Thermoproteota archaeon]|nr:SRPBCC family protein [Thermoproteota archaeon]
MSDMELRKTIEIDAPAHAVFRALTDSKELTQWWPDIGTFEPRVGGELHFTFLASASRKWGTKKRGTETVSLAAKY